MTGNQLTTTIPASAIAAPGTVAVTVTNPGHASGGIYGAGGTASATSTPHQLYGQPRARAGLTRSSSPLRSLIDKESPERTFFCLNDFLDLFNAWLASFPPDLWPAEEEETADGIYLRLKDGTRLVGEEFSWRKNRNLAG